MNRVLSVSRLLRTIATAAPYAHKSPKMTCNCPFVCAPHVDIDPSGVFKYILVKVFDENNQELTIIVRGYKRHEWHNNIFDEVKEKLKPLRTEPLGGGKISHNPDERRINIYGTSTGYGPADHELTAKLIKQAFPEYTVAVGEEAKKEEK